MKYSRLTKEQFDEMHQEFINFLATQSITAKEWEAIKSENPEAAEQELDVFSDLIWQGVLQKIKYLENISPQQMFLFHIEDNQIRVIVIKIEKPQVDITTKEGYHWLKSNLFDESVKLFNGKKPYSDDKLMDRFNLIQQGAIITKGELFQFFDQLLKSSI
ncbi:DUF6495 family protein [Paucihalobacter sp.]|uniref:DUF6495 family protein n=1 Tax=Paucihalobacter sp. TaxID=2850405 RepID=UPI002FDF6C42